LQVHAGVSGALTRSVFGIAVSGGGFIRRAGWRVFWGSIARVGARIVGRFGGRIAIGEGFRGGGFIARGFTAGGFRRLAFAAAAATAPAAALAGTAFARFAGLARSSIGALAFLAIGGDGFFSLSGGTFHARRTRLAFRPLRF
jgi:hypothetical protein